MDLEGEYALSENRNFAEHDPNSTYSTPSTFHFLS